MPDVDILIKATDSASGAIDKITGKLSGMGTAFSDAAKGVTSGIKSNLEAAAGDLDALIGIVPDVVRIGTMVVDLAKIGAVAVDIEVAYDRMASSIAGGTAVLDKLKESSKNTIGDTALMGVVVNTLAGAGEELTKTLLPAQPAIMEIARALHAANPLVGDTVDLYARLNEAVKRHSEGALESQGIMVDFAGAQTELADSLGIGRIELDDNQKSQAMLNALLEAGAPLVAEWGGNIARLSDPYAQLDANISSLSENVAKLVTVPVSKAAGGLAEFTEQLMTTAEVQATGDKALIAANQNYAATLLFYRRGAAGYTEEMLKQAAAARDLAFEVYNAGYSTAYWVQQAPQIEGVAAAIDSVSEATTGVKDGMQSLAQDEAMLALFAIPDKPMVEAPQAADVGADMAKAMKGGLESATSPIGPILSSWAAELSGNEQIAAMGTSFAEELSSAIVGGFTASQFSGVGAEIAAAILDAISSEIGY